VHHELELVVALSGPESVFGYAVGLDMTRRDLQAIAKKGGRPWEASKAFDKSAPLGSIVPAAEAGDIAGARMTLDVNGERRQEARVSGMIWSVKEIIAELGRYFDLAAGDLIYTGTPSGVGPVVKGDRLLATIDGLASLEVTVV
jgi:fumarylpyruvate hydrolase